MGTMKLPSTVEKGATSLVETAEAVRDSGGVRGAIRRWDGRRFANRGNDAHLNGLGRFAQTFAIGLFGVLLAACGGPSVSYMGGRAQSDLFVGSRAGTSSAGQEVFDDVSYWDGMIPGGGSPSIVVNLTQQRAYFYQGSKLVGVALVATGREGFGTPAGNYTIIEKLVEKRSNLFGTIYDVNRNVVKYPADVRKDPVPPGGEFVGAEMPYWMRLTNGGIGLHEGPIPVPGSPASHGCIRVSKLVVQDFFNHAPLGTPVRIVY